MTSDVRDEAVRARLIARVRAIVTTPKTEWPVIAVEPASIADLYRNYIAVLAVIPVVSMFLKSSIIGYSVPFLGTIRTGIVRGLIDAVLMYGLSLAGVFVVALIIDAFAPRFGGEKNQMQALKTVAYAYAAYFVASAAQILPAIGGLIVLAGALYSIYLLYLGLPVMMKVATERAMAYTAAVVVCTIVLGLVIGLVVGSVIGGPSLTGLTRSTETIDPNSPLGKLDSYAANLEQASKNLEAAQKSGDAGAQQDALSKVLGAALGGGSKTEALPPDQMRSFVPDRLAGLARTDITVERNAALGIQVSEARATYSNGADNKLQLEITDLGGAAGVAALAAWAGVEQERQTAGGFERTYRRNGRIMHEQWNQDSKSGQYAVIVANRFTVEVSGAAASMDALKAAAESLNLAALERQK